MKLKGAAVTCNILVEARVCTISEPAGRRKDPKPHWLPATPVPPVTAMRSFPLGNDSKGQDGQVDSWQGWADGGDAGWAQAGSRALTSLCSCGAFQWQLRTVAPWRHSTLCRAAPSAPRAPTSSTFFPPGRHKESHSDTPSTGHNQQQLHGAPPRPPTAAALQKGLQRGSDQDSAVCLHHRSSCASTGSSSGAPAVMLTTGLKELPGDSLNPNKQVLFWLSGILHKSFHSCLLLSTFNLLFTVLLQRSSLQQLWISVRETTSEALP